MHRAELPTLNPSHLDFSRATPVISAAQKFVLPVPAFADGGEPLRIPQTHADAGRAITDWKGRTIGERGIVFWNPTDQSWQAAPGDGQAVIIMNQVSPAQADLLFARYLQLGEPMALSLDALKDFLRYATDTVGINDLYHSDRAFIRAHMTPVQLDGLVILDDGDAFGFMKRDARDIAVAVYIDTPFQFDMAADNRPVQQMPNGGVIVSLASSTRDRPSIHAIQPDAFQQTYRLADGGRVITDLDAMLQRVTVADVLQRAVG
jgi:hypothetical protein